MKEKTDYELLLEQYQEERNKREWLEVLLKEAIAEKAVATYRLSEARKEGFEQAMFARITQQARPLQGGTSQWPKPEIK